MKSSIYPGHHLPLLSGAALSFLAILFLLPSILGAQDDQRTYYFGAQVRDADPKMDGEKGIVLMALDPDAPAGKSGLLELDMITDIDGIPVSGTDMFIRLLNASDGSITVTRYRRSDNTREKVRVVLEKFSGQIEKENMPQLGSTENKSDQAGDFLNDFFGKKAPSTQIENRTETSSGSAEYESHQTEAFFNTGLENKALSPMKPGILVSAVRIIPPFIAPKGVFDIEVDCTVTDGTVPDQDVPFSLTYAIKSGEKVLLTKKGELTIREGVLTASGRKGLKAGPQPGPYILEVSAGYKGITSTKSVPFEIR